MQIGSEEYRTIAIIDDKNNLLGCLNDETAIASTSIRIIAEKEEGSFGFVVMEDGSTKCFIRDGKTPLPKGTMTTEEFYTLNAKKAEEKAEVLDAEPVEETPVVEEEPETIEVETATEGIGGKKENKEEGASIESVMKILQKLPPEAIGKVVQHMTKNIKEAKKDDADSD